MENDGFQMRFWMFLLVLSSFFASCDTEVALTKPSVNQYFSMYGLLDVYADTQFVRISPLRSSPLQIPTKLDAKVVLEDVQTGEKTTLRDSLATVKSATESRINVHNFWTTTRLRWGATYRLSATNSQGQTSMSEVVMPTEPPQVQLVNPWSIFSPNLEVPQHVYMQGQKQFFHVRIRYDLRSTNVNDVGRRWHQTYTFVPVLKEGVFDAFINAPKHLREMTGKQSVNGGDIAVERITVLGYGSDLPLSADLSEEQYALASSSNVQNGVGIVIPTAVYRTDWSDLTRYLNLWLGTRNPRSR